MESLDDVIAVASDQPRDHHMVECSPDYAFQLQLLKQQNQSRKRIDELKRSSVTPLNARATCSSPKSAEQHNSSFYDYIFLDGTIYHDTCVGKLLEFDPKLYEDLRDTVHVQVPDKEVSLCFCGYYSSKATELASHIVAASSSERRLEPLLGRLPGTNMCDECQRTMRRATRGDFTDTWYDGDSSIIEFVVGRA